MTGKNPPFAVSAPMLALWTPTKGVHEVAAGVEFDVVRVRGLLGLEVCAALHSATSRDAGPVVMEDRIGDESRVWVRYFVPVGAARNLTWPPGVGVAAPGDPVSVPAFCGNTWPYSWLSRPTAGARLVDVHILLGTLCGLTGWSAR